MKTTCHTTMISTLFIIPVLGLWNVTTAQADGLTTSATLAMTTDYVTRGISQTQEEPAIQGSFNINHGSGIYMGIWGSNVDFGNSAQLEIDLSAGFRKTYSSGWSLDLAAIHYEYPGAISSLDLDFQEYSLGTGYTINGIEWSAKGFYSPEYPDSNESAFYLETGLDYTFPSGITASGHYGYSTGDHYDNTDSEYSDYSLGLSMELGGFGFDVSGFANDIDSDDAVNDNRVVLTVSKEF